MKEGTTYKSAIQGVEGIFELCELTAEESLVVLEMIRFKLVKEGVKRYESIGWASNEEDKDEEEKAK